MTLPNALLGGSPDCSTDAKNHYFKSVYSSVRNWCMVEDANTRIFAIRSHAAYYLILILSLFIELLK